jgi:hypothetical protein
MVINIIVVRWIHPMHVPSLHIGPYVHEITSKSNKARYYISCEHGVKSLHALITWRR